MRNHVVSNRCQRSVAARAQHDVLFRLRPSADRAEHLRTREHELDRLFDFACRHCRQYDVRPRRTFAAESAADEWIDDAHFVERNAERFRDGRAHAGDILGRVVEQKLIAFP